VTVRSMFERGGRFAFGMCGGNERLERTFIKRRKR
jgi:hypothetical protein